MNWYIFLHGQTRGPFETKDIIEKIQKKTVTFTTPIYQEGAKQWNVISEVSDFKNHFLSKIPDSAYDKLELNKSYENDSWVVLKKEVENGVLRYIQMGPYTTNEILEKLRLQFFNLNDHIWKSGFDKWQLISNTKEFQESSRESVSKDVLEAGSNKTLEEKSNILNIGEKEDLLQYVILQSKTSPVPIQNKNHNLVRSFAGLDVQDEYVNEVSVLDNESEIDEFVRDETEEDDFSYNSSNNNLSQPVAHNEPYDVNSKKTLFGNIMLTALRAKYFMSVSILVLLITLLSIWNHFSNIKSKSLSGEDRLQVIYNNKKPFRLEFSSVNPNLKTVQVELSAQAGDVVGQLSYLRNIKIAVNDEGEASLSLLPLELAPGKYIVSINADSGKISRKILMPPNKGTLDQLLLSHTKKINKRILEEKKWLLENVSSLEEAGALVLDLQSQKASMEPEEWKNFVKNWYKRVRNLKSHSFYNVTWEKSHKFAFPRDIMEFKGLVLSFNKVLKRVQKEDFKSARRPSSSIDIEQILARLEKIRKNLQ